MKFLPEDLAKIRALSDDALNRFIRDIFYEGHWALGSTKDSNLRNSSVKLARERLLHTLNFVPLPEKPKQPQLPNPPTPEQAATLKEFGEALNKLKRPAVLSEDSPDVK